MVRLVIEHENVLHAHQVGHDPLQHLAFGFEGVQLVAAPLQQRAPALGEIDAFAELEGVVVGDDDLGAVHVVQHVARHQLAVLVIAVRVVRLQDPQAVLDREARRNDEKPRVKRLLCGRRTALMVCQAISIAMTVVLPAPVASFSARRISSGLASLLALVRCSRTPSPALPACGRDLGQPDGGFDRLDLAEERADAAELVMPPVLQQASRFRRYLPFTWIRQRSPSVHMASYLVDDRGRVVLLLLGWRRPFVQTQDLLRR